MSREDMVSVCKKIIQHFVNVHNCRTQTSVDCLLGRAKEDDIIKFAIDKGLKLTEDERKEMPRVIWQVKEFYGASPIGSQSHWNVLCSRLRGFV